MNIFQTFLRATKQGTYWSDELSWKPFKSNSKIPPNCCAKFVFGGNHDRTLEMAFGNQQESVSLSEQNDIDMARKSKDDQIKELKEELKKAQKEAEMQKLRATAYDKMIDLAEETFNIPIRKKSGTKQ